MPRSWQVGHVRGRSSRIAGGRPVESQVLEKIRITRRGLFKGGGTIAATYSLPSTALAGNDPRVWRDGTQVALAYLHHTWTLRPMDFGCDARLRLAQDTAVADKPPSWTITISNSSFPGTRLSANGRIRIFNKERVWCIAFEFDAFKLRGSLLLFDWLADEQQYPRSVIGKWAKELSRRFPAKAVSLPPTAVVGFARTVKSDDGRVLVNTFLITDEGQEIYVGRPGLQPGIGRLGFSFAGCDRPSAGLREDPSIRILFDRLPDAPSTHIWLNRIGTLAGSDPLVELRSGTRLSLRDVSIATGRLRYFKRPGDDCLLALEYDFEGVLVPSARYRGSRNSMAVAWPELPLGIARYHLIDDVETHEVSIQGRLPEKPFLTTKGHVRLVLSGIEDRELVRVRKTRTSASLDFGAIASLHTAFVPMKAADFNRIDFRDTHLEFFLEELLDPERRDVADAAYVLGREPVFGAVLHDKAALAVHRAADLLDLKYHFRNIYLRAKPDNAWLEKCTKLIGGVALTGPTPAMMIVHFPPQHITEKAFLRVDSGQVADNRKRIPLGEHRAYQTGSGKEFQEAVTKPGEVVSGGDGTRHEVNLENARKLRDADYSKPDVLEAFERVVEARASGPTRIAFEIPEEQTDEPALLSTTRPQSVLPMEFSLTALTDWKRLKTKVSARALAPSVTPREQLLVAGITQQTPLDGIHGKLWQIEKSLHLNGAPSADQTSIEFPYRLQLSPSAEARWITPPPLTADAIVRGVVPFYARLDRDIGGRSVRAIWSPDFEKSYGFSFQDDLTKRRHPPHENVRPWAVPDVRPTHPLWWFRRRRSAEHYRMPLDARDRHELVMLSSIYGLPALLPMPTIEVATLTTSKKKDDKKPADPSVVPLPPDFPVASSKFIGMEGLYVPRPLGRVDMTLSALGATVNLEGQWEPPSGFMLDGANAPLWPALTVEKWQHEAFQARDVFVEIVYKAFLFPCGHRCSVVKTTERTFHPDPRAPSDTTAMVAYLTQRFSLLYEEEKRLPAVSQPFGGRAMPYSAIRLSVMKPPPDIRDPYANAIPATFLKRASDIGASAFYPTLGDGTKLIFDFVLVYPDGRTSKKLSAPLIVADNTLVHDPQAVQELIGFYNTLDAEEPEESTFGRSDREAIAYEQRIKYAPEREPGDTEFRTRKWVLGAHARDVKPPEDFPLLPFVMDAVMEGADQPPFYPAIAIAEIEIQSLNTMNGATEGFTEVSHDLHFLRNGFAPGVNDAGIYLTVLKPNYLKLENRSNASGGLVTPNFRAQSIGLKGPVGGGVDGSLPNTGTTLPKASVAKSTIESAALVVRDDAAFTYELPASHQNKFDPLEFFGKALSQAKLFGIIPLKDVVKAVSFVGGAPEMIERIVYSLLDLGAEFQDKAIELSRSIREVLEETRTHFEQELAKFGKSVDSNLELTPNDLYPDLYSAMGELETSLGKFEIEALAYDYRTHINEDNVIAATSAVARAGKRMLTETRKVIRQPTPAIVDRAIGDLKGAIAMIKDGVDALNPADSIKGLKQIVTDYLVDILLKEIGDGRILDIFFKDKICDDVDVLFPLVALALTGYPDNEYEQLLEGGPWSPVTTEVCVTFDIANAEHRRRAQEALLYEVVGKPLIDGYMALDTLARRIGRPENLDEAFKELPAQIVLVVQKWLDGLLKLEQYAASARALTDSSFETAWMVVIRPILANYVVPIVHRVIATASNIRQKAEGTDQKITELYGKLLKLIQSGKAQQLQPQLEQVAATIAKTQKALTAALAEHDEVRTILGGYFDLSVGDPFADAAKMDAYLAPIEASYRNANQRALSQFNGLVGRLVAEKDSVFRRARDTMQAGIATIDILGRVNDVLEQVSQREQGGIPAQPTTMRFAVTDSERSDFSIELNALVAEVGKVIIAVGELLQESGRIEFNKISDPGISGKLGDVDAAAKQMIAKTNALTTTVKQHYERIIVEQLTAMSAAVTALGTGGVDKEKVAALRNEFLGMSAVTDKAIGYVFGEERVLTSLVSQGTTFVESTLTAIETRLYGMLSPLLLTPLDMAISIDRLAQKVHDKVTGVFKDTDELFRLFLSEDFLKLLSDAENEIKIALANELQALMEIRKGLAESAVAPQRVAAESLRKLLVAWQDGSKRPAAIGVMEPLQEVLDILLSGKISDLVDLSRLESVVEDALLSFVPKEIAFDYDWGTKLNPFPSESNQIFWIDSERDRKGPPAGSMIAKHFANKKQDPESRTSDDLVIVAKAGVRLVPKEGGGTEFTPKPFFAVESQIINPSINLFGKSFDVVTVKFEHLRFIGDDDGTDFDAKILVGSEGVKFGEAVGYITELAQLFPNFVPPWLEILFDPPGVAVKFGFPGFSVTIGALAISNLAVGIRIEIPFDNRPILGLFSLSERNRPFLISCAPYGGGGYFALRTHATSIVGFEMSLEFGAVVVIAFGPLRGFGMVTAGIYIEKEKGKDLLIAGFVRAIGEGSLGCFAIAVHIEVRVEQRGSDVNGYAIFAYTFKIAFAKFRFKFRASYAFAGGGGNGGRANNIAYARLLGASRQSRSAEEHLECEHPAEIDGTPVTAKVLVADRLTEWSEYRKYFS